MVERGGQPLRNEELYSSSAPKVLVRLWFTSGKSTKAPPLPPSAARSCLECGGNNEKVSDVVVVVAAAAVPDGRQLRTTALRSQLSSSIGAAENWKSCLKHGPGANPPINNPPRCRVQPTALTE